MKKKKIIVGLLALSVFTWVNNVKVSTFDAVADGYSVWSAPYTEKILQEVDVQDYSFMKKAAKIDLDMAKAEIETAQIVITAEKDVSSYTVKLNDLTNENGDVFSKEDVQVYSAMYVRIGTIYNEARSFPTGNFPDAMLPIETAIEYGENTVSKDCNQSLYFSFTTKYNQPAGKYTGNFELSINGESHVIPVVVNVRDVIVNTEVTSKSLFLCSWSHNLSEYDSTQRMTDLYQQALMDYRLVGNKLTYDIKNEQEDAEYYAQKVWEMYEYGSNEEKFGEGADRFSNFMLPLTLNNSSVTMHDMLLFGNEIVLLSCEKQIDFVERACVYYIDEPAAFGNLSGTIVAHNNFIAARDAWAAAIEGQRTDLKATYKVSDEFIDTLIASANNLHNIITQSYMPEFDGYVETWCPLFRSYDIASDVEKYKEQNEELWWYGCNSDKSPLPTYHIDDILLSPRLESWLKAQYGVTGNLYWAVDAIAPYEKINGVYAYKYADDYATSFGSTPPGEGLLFRPGKQYGIDGPIATIRVDAIRDGLEEFELMETLKDVYENAGKVESREFTATATINDLMSSLCSGMKIGATTEMFNKARTTLLDLSEFAQEGVCFTDFIDDGYGNIEYEVYVPNGAQLSVSNAMLKESETLTEGTLNRYAVNMENSTANYVAFKLRTDSGEKELKRALMGGINTYDAEQFVGALSGNINLSNTKLVEANTLIAEKDGKFLQLSLDEVQAANSYGYQYVRITSDLLKDIGADSQKAVFTFYYDGQDTLPVEIYVKYAKKKTLSVEYTGELKNGLNNLTWGNLNGKDWSVGNIEYIEISFGQENTGTYMPARTDIYFECITVYKIGEEE